MNFGLSEEQILLKQSLRRFLEAECPTSRVRAIMESESGHDSKLWQGLASLGVTGLVIPSEYGGSGLELLDLALAAEELGYAAAPGPFLGNAMATVALLESGSVADPSRWLPKITTGEAILTVAYGEEESQWDPERFSTRVESGRISGSKPLVPYAREAQAIVVAARDEQGTGLWIVERGAPGVEIHPLRVVDQTRRLHSVSFSNTPGTRLPGGAGALRRSLDAGSVLIAADAFGGSKRCLDMTVKYVLEREQFGQMIGAFQAVKHQVANLACELEPALSMSWYAAHAFDHIRDQSERHAALAKALLSDVFDRMTRDCVELHGGVGFTWEFDLHLWFRRAVFDRSFLGDASFHRARAADLAGW